MFLVFQFLQFLCKFVISRARGSDEDVVFRCVLASLYEGLSVRRSVGRSVRRSVGPSVRGLVTLSQKTRKILIFEQIIVVGGILDESHVHT